MPVKFVIDGIESLKDALRMLPEELTDEAGAMIRSRALNAAGAIRAGYARGKTGHLQDGVVVEAVNAFSRYGVSYRVKSKAKHAYLYEYGTVARHYYTTKGKLHATGVMPAAPPGRAFVPKMIDARERMYDDLVWLLVNHGLAARKDAA